MNFTDQTDPGGAPETRARDLRDRADSHPPDAVEALPELLTLVIEQDDQAREDAIEALDRIGRQTPDSLVQWIDDLAELAVSPKDDVAFAGLRALAQAAGHDPGAVEPVVEQVTRSLGDDHAGCRAAALAVMAELAEEAPSLVYDEIDHVLDAMDHGDPIVRSAGLMAAGKAVVADPTGADRLIEGIRDRLADPEARVRERAHWAFIAIVDEHPEVVDDPAAVIEHLATVNDAALGLVEGTVGDAIAGLAARLS